MAYLGFTMTCAPLVTTSIYELDDGEFIEIEHPYFNCLVPEFKAVTKDYSTSNLKKLNKYTTDNTFEEQNEFSIIKDSLMKEGTNELFFRRLKELKDLTANWESESNSITVCIIDPYNKLHFVIVPASKHKTFIEETKAINRFVNMKLLEDESLQSLSYEAMQFIENYPQGIYGTKSIHLKDKPILTISDMLIHMKREESVKQKLYPNANSFKSAYSKWMEECKAKKLKFAEGEQRIKLEIDKLKIELAQLRFECMPDPAPTRNEFME